MSKAGLATITQFETDFNATVTGLTDKQRKSYDSHIICCKTTIEVARELEAAMERVNPIKKKLDKAHKDNNAADFNKHHADYVTVMYQIDLTSMLSRFNRRKRWFTVIGPLHSKVKSDLAFLRSVRDNGKKIAKRMLRSPKQQAAAQQASVRMQQQWGL